MNFNHIIIPLVIAYLLDLILGDPRYLPHPIIAFGNSISFFERHLNKQKNKVVKGAFTAIILPIFVFIIFHLLTKLSLEIGEFGYYCFTTIFAFYGLANKSLIQEGTEVLFQLEKNGLEAGRKRLSWIVGRETKELNNQQIYKSVLETLAENLSDGVVAPLFYYAIGGIPAMMCYKMINTLDSMIGYKSDRYKQFGMFAARIDDIANFIPARITSILMVICRLNYRGFIFILKYGNKHSSPNAGYPESALAGILNCQFGGPNSYHGNVVNKPYIGVYNKELNYNDFKITRIVNHTVCFLSILIILSFYYFLLN